jgi:hypothetical protein
MGIVAAPRRRGARDPPPLDAGAKAGAVVGAGGDPGPEAIRETWDGGPIRVVANAIGTRVSVTARVKVGTRVNVVTRVNAGAQVKGVVGALAEKSATTAVTAAAAVEVVAVVVPAVAVVAAGITTIGVPGRAAAAIAAGGTLPIGVATLLS